MWSSLSQEIAVRHPLALPQVKEAYTSIKAIAEDGEHGLEFIKGAFSSILGAQTVESVVQVADDSQLVKKQVFGQRPDLGDIVGIYGSSVTWKTLLDVLSNFETKHTVDKVADKIVSALGGGHQVGVWVLCVE